LSSITWFTNKTDWECFLSLRAARQLKENFFGMSKNTIRSTKMKDLFFFILSYHLGKRCTYAGGSMTNFMHVAFLLVITGEKGSINRIWPCTWLKFKPSLWKAQPILVKGNMIIFFFSLIRLKRETDECWYLGGTWSPNFLQFFFCFIDYIFNIKIIIFI